MLLQCDQISQMNCNRIAINAPPQKDHPVFLHRAKSQDPEYMVVHFQQIDEAPSGKVPPESTRNGDFHFMIVSGTRMKKKCT